MPALPPTLPEMMQAVAIDSYGGIDQLKVQTIPLPKLDAGEVLIRLAYADVAKWDPLERDGAFESMNLRKTPFPLVLGSGGSGEVVAVGDGVTHLSVGQGVYAAAFLNAKGGFYGQYVACKAEAAAPLPPGLTLEQAGVFPGDAATALRGLTDVLKLRRGETVLIFGAGGGLGHLAVQLAKLLGARVFAVASGQDGVDLALRVGADAAANGRAGDVGGAIHSFAPNGLDAALMTAGGDAANAVLTLLKPTGRVAYPHGVEPAPQPPAGIDAQAYDGDVDTDVTTRLNQFIARSPFTVHVAQTFTMEQAADAHKMLGTHYVGKLAMKIT